MIHTVHKSVAKRKLARFLAGEIELGDLRAQAKRGETYAELADRVRKARKADGVRDTRCEENREKHYILPHLGRLELKEIRPAHIRELLEEAQASGKARVPIDRRSFPA